MAQTAKQPRELKNIGYEIFIGLLSILSILNLVLQVVFRDPSMDTVVLVMNALFMPIFLGDFLYRLFTAESKSGYFFRNFGWADLLSSLPFAQFKILRVFRLWRVIRLDAELRLAQPGARIRRRSRRERLVDGCLPGLLRPGVRLPGSALRRAILPQREHHQRFRRDLVGLRHHHHRRLRRSVPGDQCRPPRRRLGHDGRRGSVRHPQRFPGQHVPHAAEEEGGAGRRLQPMPTTPRLSSPNSSG